MNGSLPIDITGAQVQQYPELVHLLTELSQRITPDGVSLHTKQELEQVSKIIYMSLLKVDIKILTVSYNNVCITLNMEVEFYQYFFL